jgi:hypothetical protein
LIYNDPEGRFHFLFPQELRIERVYPDGVIDLVHHTPDGGRDGILIGLLPKSKDPQKDRLAADPIQEMKALTDQWKKEGQEYVMGPTGWLPEAEWSTLRRKVHRSEAALKRTDVVGPASKSGRIYVDEYMVQFNRNEAVKVLAMTTQDPHLNFRNQAELVIKSFDFGPSDGTAPVSSSPSPGSTPAPPQ